MNKTGYAVSYEGAVHRGFPALDISSPRELQLRRSSVGTMLCILSNKTGFTPEGW